MIKTKIPAEYQKEAEEDRKYFKEIFQQIKKEYNTKSYPTKITTKQTNNKTATAIAYPIQGILKYHGMPDWKYRTAYFPSISLCNDAAYTITTVEFSEKIKKDIIIINNKQPTEREKERILAIINFLRKETKTNLGVKIISNNYFSNNKQISSDKKNEIPKGLGTSASAGAALALAAIDALLGKKYSSNEQFVSAIARLLAGSACRSVTGGISLWLSYVGIEHENCIALRLDNNQFQNIELITIPIASTKELKTEQAHLSATSSPFFKEWLESRKKTLPLAIDAIKRNDFFSLAKLAEQDTTALHLITMTGAPPLILYENKTLQIMEICTSLRKQEIPIYLSIDTGPTVVFMTTEEYTERIIKELEKNNIKNWITGKIAPAARLMTATEIKKLQTKRVNKKEKNKQ